MSTSSAKSRRNRKKKEQKKRQLFERRNNMINRLSPDGDIVLHIMSFLDTDDITNIIHASLITAIHDFDVIHKLDDNNSGVTTTKVRDFLIDTSNQFKICLPMQRYSLWIELALMHSRGVGWYSEDWIFSYFENLEDKIGYNNRNRMTKQQWMRKMLCHPPIKELKIHLLSDDESTITSHRVRISSEPLTYPSWVCTEYDDFIKWCKSNPHPRDHYFAFKKWCRSHQQL